MRPAVAFSLLLFACTGSRGQPQPPLGGSPCPHQAEIDELARESARLSKAAEASTAEVEAARKELDAARGDEARAAARARVLELEADVDALFARADESFFRAEWMQETCLPARPPARARGRRAHAKARPPGSPCPEEAAIRAHSRESVRLSEVAREVRDELEAARRELDEATDEETRAAVRQRIHELESEPGILFARADEHHFTAKRLREECDRAASRRR